MANVRVYNPSNTPVVIDDGRTVAGSDWQVIPSSPLVDEFIKARRLILKDKLVPQKTEQANDLPKPEPEPEPESAPDNVDVEPPTDEPSTATISKGRRSRKPPSDKE
jgi:hypothetical protein